MMTPLTATRLLSSVLLAFLGSALGAQERGKPATVTPSPTLLIQERIDVNIVNVEVVVTRKGEPVTGLSIEDFRITDDGKEIEITNFFEVADGLRHTAGRHSATDTSTLPRERGYVVILVDHSFLAPTSRAQGLAELRRQLPRILGEGNLIMVAQKDRSVLVEQHFTDDLAEIDAALGRVAKQAGRASMSAGQERIIQAQLQAGADPVTGTSARAGGFAVDPGVADAGDVLAQIHIHAQEIASTVRTSLKTLDSFLSSLAGLQGRKAMIYLADDLPLRPAELLFFNWFDKYGAYAAQNGIASAEDGASRYDTSPFLGDMLANASSNRVSFYPITPNNNPNITSRSPRQDGALSSTSFAIEASTTNSDGILLMARETGGMTAPSVASIDDLVERLSNDLGSYYSLGFASPHGGDSKSHQVRVSVSDPDLRVRHLRNYRDKNAEELLTERTLSALYLDAAENPLEAWVEVGQMEKDGRKRYLVPLLVKLPLGKLTLLPEAKSHVGQVSICVIVRDEEGRLSEPQMIPVPVSIPNDKMLAANTTAAAWPTRLAMRPGKGQRIGITIRDDVSSVSSTLNVEVDVAGGGGVASAKSDTDQVAAGARRPGS